MAPAPQRGTLTLRGDRSGRAYSVNMYVSDVAAAFVTFNANGQAGTGSPTFYVIPEDCILEDISLTTGLTDTTQMVLQANQAVVPGTVIRYADFINTLNDRPKLGLGIRQGTQLQFLQG